MAEMVLMFRVFLNASHNFSQHFKALSISLPNFKVLFNVMALFVHPSFVASIYTTKSLIM